MSEAQNHFNLGVKHETKKAFFGALKPEWDSAASEFEQAAIGFKNAKISDLCVESYSRAANAHVKVGSYFMAAKAYENAGQMCSQGMKDFNGASQWYKQASDLFISYGSPDKAAECLEKAAKGLEDINQEQAGNMYLDACAIFDDEDRSRMGIETYKRTLYYFVKTAQWFKAITASERLGEIYIKHDNRHGYNRQALSTVILCLALGDEVDASKRMDKYAEQPSFTTTEECRIAGSLIEAYENRDTAAFELIQKMQILTLLDNEIARIAVKLKIPGTQQAVQAEVEEEDGFC